MTTVLVEFVGELDLSHEERIRDALALAAQADVVTIDLSAVTYMDSTVLSALAHFRKERRSRGRDLPPFIAGANRMARRLLEITRLETVFEFIPVENIDRAGAMRVMVLGRQAPKNAGELAEAVVRLLSIDPQLQFHDEPDGVHRWVCRERQCQVHCISDRELVILSMRQGIPGAMHRWEVEDVQHVLVDDATPWSAAGKVVEYLHQGV